MKLWYHACSMTFRMYLFLMSFSTVIAWIAWVIVIQNVNPNETGVLGFGLFYITLITGLVGVLSLCGIVYRVLILRRHAVLIREVKVSFRHALLLSAVAVSSLALAAHDLLRWWVLLVLIGIVSLIEYVALLVQHARRT